MRTIGQRELRNSSGAIVRGLSRGETYRITSRGKLVGILVPAERTSLDDMALRAGTQHMEFPPAPRRAEHISDVLRELRADV